MWPGNGTNARLHRETNINKELYDGGGGDYSGKSNWHKQASAAEVGSL
jgi:hypothetical protein